MYMYAYIDALYPSHRIGFYKGRTGNQCTGSLKFCPTLHFSWGLHLVSTTEHYVLFLPLSSPLVTQLADLNWVLMTKHIRSMGYRKGKEVPALKLEMCLQTGSHLERSAVRSSGLLLQHCTMSPWMLLDRICFYPANQWAMQKHSKSVPWEKREEELRKKKKVLKV